MRQFANRHSNSTSDVHRIANIIAETGSKSELKFEPLPKDDPKQRCPDITRARTWLGWEPRVLFREGLKRTIEWYYATRNKEEVKRIFTRMLTER